MQVQRISLGEWAEVLPAAKSEVFHKPEVLAVLAEHAPGDLRLYCGYRGDEPVALLPAFVREAPVGTAVLTPPPGFSVPRLGPVMNETSSKRRKQEQTNRKFTEAVLDATGARDALTLFWSVGGVGYADPRPYAWEGFDITPKHAYRLDLADETADEILAGFTRDLRSEIRKFEEVDLNVDVGGPDAAVRIYDDYRERFAEQGANFPTPRAYTRDLVEALDDRARAYTAETPDGEFLGGITVLYSDDTAYFWQGGMRANYQGLSVNSWLHWRIIEDVLRNPELAAIERYDLGRAVDDRLARYKSKFGSALVPYYEVKSGELVDVAKRAYKFVTY